MVLGGLRSAFPMATGPAPCYEPPSSLPAITTFIPAAAALIFREEVVKGFFLGVPHPSCFPSLLGWHSPACIPPKPSAPVPIHPSSCRDLLSVQQEGKGRRKRRRKATKNRHHGNSLPGSAESQRAAPPSLLGAGAGPSILFWGGFRKVSVLRVPAHIEGCSMSPKTPTPISGVRERGSAWGARGWEERGGCVRVPGCLCARVLARGR